MTLVLYYNPLDVLLYKCSGVQHMRCMYDTQKIYEILYDILPLPSCLIYMISNYNDNNIIIIIEDDTSCKLRDLAFMYYVINSKYSI